MNRRKNERMAPTGYCSRPSARLSPAAAASPLAGPKQAAVDVIDAEAAEVKRPPACELSC